MDARQQKARAIVAGGKITRGDGCFHVPSQSRAARHRVVIDGLFPSCTCADFELTERACKHMLAVKLLLEEERTNQQRTPTAPEPSPPRLTYKQNWPAYVRAQCNEKRRFQVLLHELCRGVEEPPAAKTGRPRVPLADAVFASAFKVYSTLSSRRFNCDLQDAHAAGYLSRPIHPHKISAFLENPVLTPTLRGLIAESSCPLAVAESDFTADSSAFTSNKFARWYDEKYGKERTFHAWQKVQVMSGVKTNIITSAIVCDQDGPDSPYLPQLVNETAERFTMKEVSADKGYSSAYGHDAVAAVGATPFIAFKKTATGGSGGVWAKMFHFFQFQRDEYLARYHKRSNAESVFSAVKRKFGDALRSKDRTAQVNELLCKLLCHNICVLIQEQEELGIVPYFWSDEPAEERAVIPFPGRLTRNSPG